MLLRSVCVSFSLSFFFFFFSNRPAIPNPGADRFYDLFAYSFQALQSDSDDYMDILRVLSTQLQYVPPEEETFHLSINGRNIGHALLAMANALMGDQHVAQLSIESAGIDAVTLQILVPVLSVNHTLKELYLTGNNLGPSGVKALTRALLKNRSLTSLHIGCTACGDEGAAWVADLLASGSSGLRRIDMSGNGITELGFAVLLDAVKANELVVELQLRDNDVSDEVRAPITDLCKARFKPFMEQLRKEDELRTALRKSAVMAPSSGNAKKSSKFSLKQRIKLGKQSRSSAHPVMGGSSGSGGEEETFASSAPPPRGKRADLRIDVDAAAAPPAATAGGSRSAPGSPNERKSGRLNALISGSRTRGVSVGGKDEDSEDSDTSDEGVNVDPAHVLRLHIIEAARLKPVQKNGVSDPLCHSVKMDVRGRPIRTQAQRKTLSPQWDQWFEVAFDILSEWSFELLVQDEKILGDKGKLGFVTVSSKDWDLSEEKGQEQWLDISDGLGAVRIGLQATPASLPELQRIVAQRKELAAREKEARDLAAEQRAGRPRGRTMLAPPKAVVQPAAAVAAAEKVQAKIPRSASLQVRVATAETMGRRPTMEDAILVQGQLGGDARRDLFAVFDGHGSERVAIHCAERLGAVLVELLDVAKKPPLEALRAAFLALSAEVAPFAINMGCTVVAALLQEGVVHVANCGDTRAVLCSAAGVAERLTVDHKPSLPDEIKRIEELGGFVRNGRVQGQLAVSRALGDANFAPFISSEPYLRSAPVTEDHTHLVLACDGLWDVFPDSLACQIVCNQPEPAQAAVMLRDRAFASGSTDNISVAVVQFKPPSAEKAATPPKAAREAKAADPGADPFGAFGQYVDDK